MDARLSEIAHHDPRLLKPLELFAAGKVNCCQVVIMPYIKDMPPGAADTLMDMTAGLGGGVAGLGYVCGALLGGAMVLGRKLRAENLSGDECEAILRQFVHQFGKDSGAQFCSGIKAMAGKKDEYTACQKLVIHTIESVDRLLERRAQG